MKLFSSFLKKDPFLFLAVIALLTISLVVLRSIAPLIFPNYFLYLAIALIFFVLFSHIDFDILILFKWQIYVFCITFLIIPLVIGQVTRGAVRWIPLGPLTLQPSEIVRPFLIMFFAGYITESRPTIKRLLKALPLLGFPIFLIIIQPSLGVSILTAVGFLGVLLASSFSKKHLLLILGIGILLLPLLWLVLAPYQRSRVLTFLSPQADPSGAGYNSLQSMISVGSGNIWGRGLGEGVQTQLDFLPERHTDFIFASVAEELGFVGAMVLIFGSFFLLFRLTSEINVAKSQAARCFIAGFFLSLFLQTVVHIGMNMGLFPITGLPLPLVSAGGSSLLATMMGLGIVVATR